MALNTASTAPIRPRDPERAQRIIDATIVLIGTIGVAGVSARKIAAAAGVPLGSITYYFASIDDLVFSALEKFSYLISDRFERYMAAAKTPEEARQQVIDLIAVDVLTDPSELIITHELYALAARDQKYRELTHNWMARSRSALEKHFDPVTARMLDALIEGLSIHRALDTEPHPIDEIANAVDRILGSKG